jgi:N-acetyl-alpha-D-glucosaminyl L-malate synthase BshA
MLREVDARLIMVWDGPERPRAVTRAEELGVRDRVLFLGKHASMDELLACADLFLLPSSNESFGLAALEAMACGAPVVASRVGGIPEVVDHGVTGYLFPPEDLDEMARAGCALLLDEEARKAMSERARVLSVERFSADAVVPRYETLYREIVADAGAST